MSRPQFKSINAQVAELAAYAATHTPEETRAKLAALPLAAQRKILARLSLRPPRQRRAR